MSADFQDHFSGVARAYGRFRPRYPAGLFDHLAEIVPDRSAAWDCACGNGQATVDLADRFDRVIGTDASARQIAEAAPHPRVEYRVAAAERSGLPDQSVALVTVAQALHWFDLGRFHEEVRRVLVPGGVLAAWAYGTCEIEGRRVNELVQDYYANTVGPWWPPSRALIESGYRTVPFPYEEIAPPSFRMESAWTLEQLLGYLGTWSATNRYIESTGRNPLEPLGAELRKAWGDPGATRRIAWPLSLRIGRVGR